MNLYSHGTKECSQVSCATSTYFTVSNLKVTFPHSQFSIEKIIFLFSFVEIEFYPVRCLVSDVTNVACGADFTVWLTSVEGASILYGQCFFFDIGFFVMSH